jgi:hypothetical protein
MAPGLQGIGDLTYIAAHNQAHCLISTVVLVQFLPKDKKSPNSARAKAVKFKEISFYIRPKLKQLEMGDQCLQVKYL